MVINISTNRKASFNYFIEDKYEAGIVLLSSEVKSARDKKVSIDESYAVFQDDGIYLQRSYIGHYKNASYSNHDVYRPRKLLLHSKEIRKIIGKTKLKGYCIAVISMYFNSRNIVKVSIALAKGKKLYDKRKSIKEREWQRRKSLL